MSIDLKYAAWRMRFGRDDIIGYLCCNCRYEHDGRRPPNFCPNCGYRTVPFFDLKPINDGKPY